MIEVYEQLWAEGFETRLLFFIITYIIYLYVVRIRFILSQF